MLMKVLNKIRKMFNDLKVAKFNTGLTINFKHPTLEWKRVC